MKNKMKKGIQKRRIKTKNKDEYTEFIWIESGNSKIYFYKLVSILYKRVIEDSYESKGSDRREDSS